MERSSDIGLCLDQSQSVASSHSTLIASIAYVLVCYSPNMATSMGPAMSKHCVHQTVLESRGVARVCLASTDCASACGARLFISHAARL